MSVSTTIIVFYKRNINLWRIAKKMLKRFFYESFLRFYFSNIIIIPLRNYVKYF